MVDIEKDHQKKREVFFQELIKLLELNIWSDDLIKRVESNCSFKTGYHKILFPLGNDEIITKFESWQDNIMMAELLKINKPEKIREKISTALQTRIIKIIPKKSLLHCMGFFARPEAFLSAQEASYKTCDIIWKYAGDKSTDFNHYTKRILLFGVYSSAKAYYLADNSKNYINTQNFIKNALDNIVNIASLKNKINMPDITQIPILRLFS